MLYLDTSLLVSALTQEESTPAMQAWLAQQDAGRLAISDWVVTEFSSALAIKLRTRALRAQDRAAALATLTRLTANSLDLLPVSRQAFRTAARFVDQAALNLRAGDALHLAICAEAGATLCTRDQRLAAAAPQLGVPIAAL